jgi:methylenetetrahydrofolate dehydrogenase (NADP+)/methenyltetrahydrofolate cyclohydrolase
VLHSYKMPAHIIDGKAISKAMRAELSQRASQLVEQGLTPGLAVVLVGDDPASASYVRSKRRACERVGITTKGITHPESVSESELLGDIEALNKDPAVHGILVQLPLPPHIRENAVLEAVDPEKDVDGFHPVNLGRLLQGGTTLPPCTPAGILELLRRAGVEPARKHVAVVGRSNIVGKPLAALLMQKHAGANATVTICHSGTAELARHTRSADIVVVATGAPHTLTGEMVTPGAVVVDVGVTRVEDSTDERGYRLVGDVDFASVSEVAGMISPVPGGVGPMTITMLLSNTIWAAERSNENG